MARTLSADGRGALFITVTVPIDLDLDPNFERDEREGAHHPLPVRGVYRGQALPAHVLEVEQEVRDEDRRGPSRKRT